MHKITTSFFLLALALGGAAQAAENERHAQLEDLGPVGIAAKGERVLDVKADTRYLNVRNGETVTIRQGDRSITWSVQAAPHINLVPLSRILPSALAREDGSKEVLVYIAPGHQYQDF